MGKNNTQESWSRDVEWLLSGSRPSPGDSRPMLGQKLLQILVPRKPSHHLLEKPFTSQQPCSCCSCKLQKCSSLNIHEAGRWGLPSQSRTAGWRGRSPRVHLADGCTSFRQLTFCVENLFGPSCSHRSIIKSKTLTQNRSPHHVEPGYHFFSKDARSRHSEGVAPSLRSRGRCLPPHPSPSPLPRRSSKIL